MSAPLSPRPRLGEHVLVRRHHVEGEERVVLHDLRTGRLLQIGPREWALLAAADGTRDLGGIVLAAAREGAHAREPALLSYFTQLHQAGLLADEPLQTEAPASGSAASTTAPSERSATDLLAEDAPSPPDRPLAFLPDFSLHCDGTGSCCRLYASVLFSPVETARARALLPLVLDGGARPERIFTPEQGPGPSAGAAVAQIDGRCAYLDEARRCGIHARGGEDAKPFGCRLFPASFLDDGEVIRVSTRVECACVLDSVGRAGGSPLIPPGARVFGELDPAVHIDHLPARVAVRNGEHGGRAAIRRLTHDLLTSPALPDVPRALWSLARSLDAHGLLTGTRHALDPAAPSIAPDALRPFIAALHARAARRAQEDAVWRSPRDLARLVTRAIDHATANLLDPGALTAHLARPAASPDGEAFYLRAVLHGGHLVGDLPLVRAFQDRAVRLLVARALPAAFTALAIDDPATRQPLALLEAMLRGHGLSAYAHDLDA